MATRSPKATPWRPLLAAMGLALAAGCADRLPDQDLRILQAVPVAKMPVEDLWKEYSATAADASRKYRHQAVEVSGKVTSAGSDAGGHQYLLFVQSDSFGVRANLLDDQAAAIVAAAPPGTRVTLRCYCEGLDGHVVLKSCVKP